jgi:hypothetical protein
MGLDETRERARSGSRVSFSPQNPGQVGILAKSKLEAESISSPSPNLLAVRRGGFCGANGQLLADIGDSGNKGDQDPSNEGKIIIHRFGERTLKTLRSSVNATSLPAGGLPGIPIMLLQITARNAADDKAELRAQQVEYFYVWARAIKACCESQCLDAFCAFFTLTTDDPNNPNPLLITADDKERVKKYGAVLEWLFTKGGTEGACAARDAISALYNVVKLSVRHIPQCVKAIDAIESAEVDDGTRVVGLVKYIYESFGKVTTAVGDQFRRKSRLCS